MKRNIVIATVAAAALIGGGTATALAVSGDDETPDRRSSVQVKDDDRDDDRDDDKSQDRDDDGEDGAVRSGAAKVTAADAIAAALKHTSGTAVGAELDSEGSDLVWDVDVLGSGTTWHSVLVDPGTGKVLDSRAEDEDADDTADTRAALKGTSVPAAEAAQAAAAKGTVTSLDLDDDGRDHAWEIDTTGADGTESEWDVDLKTAKVTADRSDDNSDDRNDRDDDGDDSDD
ncbi:PepSY domain-containing protein [Streptomyces sp. CRN 30]|uniref:PepSY domain-containing protein n=1 Tax=Streptomyces sp. CRN 30 TaxID=3075613 RepID=UPI002A8119E4|nr:PepSY domain-containing protein [Streptomyces sp. CRN 30]